MALHLWLVTTQQPATDGGNGTITLQGYGFFQSIDPIEVYPGGEVLIGRPLPAEPRCLAML